MYDWKGGTTTVVNETREVLQLVYDSLNHGQREKLLKNEKVREKFDHYGVKYDN